MVGDGDQHCVDTNDAGEYQLSSLAQYGYTVTASSPGFAIATANDSRPIYLEPGAQRAGVDIVLGDRGYDIAGRVLDALGGPVVAASVRIVSWGETMKSTSLLSDADGRFAASLGAQYFTAIASAPGYASARVYHVAPTQDLTLALAPEVSIAGKVLTQGEERPIAGAQVFARTVDLNSGGSGETLSAEDGSFCIAGLEPGRYTVTATAKGYRGNTGGVHELSLGQSLTRVWVLVTPAAQVSGRVLIDQLDQPGSTRPCEQGFVTLGLPHPALSLREPSKWTEDAVGAQATPPTSVMALIGVDGAVRFDAVPAGTYFASVDCQDHLQHSGPDIVKVATGDVEGLVWHVVPASRLSIRAVDERDRAVPGASVEVVWPNGTLTTLTAGTDGWTPPVTHLYPGVYKVRAEGGYRAESVAIEIKPGVPEVRGTLRLKGDAVLEVEVQDHNGRAVDDVQVVAEHCRSARASDGDAIAPGEANRERWAGIALGLGRFRIGPVAAGCYRVAVSDAVHPQMAEAAGEARDVEVHIGAGQLLRHRATLNREAAIEGQVLAEDGSPLPDVWVSALAAGKVANRLEAAARRNLMYAANRVITNHDGRFRVTALERGRAYDLSAEATIGVSAVRRGVAAGTRVTITMPEAGIIEGTVTSERGRPLDEFRLEVIETETQRAESHEFTHASGRFALSGITPGKLQVQVVDSSGRSAQLETELHSGQRLAGLRLSISSQLSNQGPP